MSDDHPTKTDNPGGDNAIAKGCTCPRLDNAHGLGYLGNPGHFVIAVGCPMHAPDDTYSETPPWGVIHALVDRGKRGKA